MFTQHVVRDNFYQLDANKWQSVTLMVAVFIRSLPSEGTWRKTMELYKPCNPLTSKPEILNAKGVRGWTVQKAMKTVLSRATAGTFLTILNPADSRE